MASPPHPQSPNIASASASQYASTGLDILQAASDAAQAIENPQALQDAAAEAVGQPMVGDELGQVVPGSGGSMRDPTINPKLTRLRRACDMCSMRKVRLSTSHLTRRDCG